MMNNNYILTNGTINCMKAFADTVKTALELGYGDGVKVVVQDVRKNNGVTLTGLTVVQRDCNISPTIYLNPYYEEYKAGTTMANICREIMDVYEANRVQSDFDITMVTDFNKVKDNVCFKVVNAERNKELLATVPHKQVLDLAVVFFIEVLQNKAGSGTITIQNHFMDMWDGVDTDTLYRLALMNTQRKYRGRICSMFTVMQEILDEAYATEFFDMMCEDDVPMYVATNVQKVFGASVVLYDGLLRTFAEQIGGDFFILPSSTHEVLFVPATDDMDATFLKQMVHDVNEAEVSEQEFLSNNVYRYSIDTDCMAIV